MNSDYFNSLLERYNWYISEIEQMHRNHHWKNLPSNSFYYKLQNGPLKAQLHDQEWLEYAIDKLQENLAGIEEKIREFEQSKKSEHSKFI
jgi:hypothetical protein